MTTVNGVEKKPATALTEQPTIVWVYILFFFSGFPALIYQIVWQRALFSIYGVNIESVTMVVSAFMLGLGLGSLLGGFVSERPNTPLLAIFGLVELGAAGFGIVSLQLFHSVASVTAGVLPLGTGLIAFILVVIPTIFMGSTLPLLVAHLVPLSQNVGRSVGMLYFVNTLGSAVACYLAGKILMRMLGESGSVTLAAAINATIGSAVLVLYFLSCRYPPSPASVRIENKDFESRRSSEDLVSFPLAILISGLSGFISLSYEIVWYRLFSFTSGGEAKSFAYLLGAFLAGIAFGSVFAWRLCRDLPSGRRTQRDVRLIAFFVIFANLLGFLVAPLLAYAVRSIIYTHTLPLVTAAAGLLGAIFPLICHVSVKADHRTGASLSYLYLSNILGSTLGTFLVGFVLMDNLTLRQISVVLALSGLGLGTAILLTTKLKGHQLAALLGSTVVLAILVIFSSHPLFADIYERLQKKNDYRSGMRFVHVLENKSGVITVDEAGTVYGGGVYDGKFNTDLTHDTNAIVRAYSLSSFHPAPKDVLMIGLSSGSWAQIIANHPQVERLTIVEINPGYLRLIPKYSQVASLLQNEKVEIVIDDGRRWLVRNPNRRFDVIVSNTSFFWRAHATNLLSEDFLRLCRAHLKEGGILFYNTTDSEDVQLTGAKTFPYALRVINMLAVSDRPIQVDAGRWRRTLLTYRLDGKPIFNYSRPEDQRKLDEIMSLAEIHPEKRWAMEYGDTLRNRFNGKLILTDDNMGLEWP